MNGAYNQMALDEQSRRLTQFIIGNQKQFEEKKDFSLNKFQTNFQTLLNHLMQCAMLQVLSSVQYFYNPTMEQIK